MPQDHERRERARTGRDQAFIEKCGKPQKRALWAYLPDRTRG
jgi:hypothetical protein